VVACVTSLPLSCHLDLSERPRRHADPPSPELGSIVHRSASNRRLRFGFCSATLVGLQLWPAPHCVLRRNRAVPAGAVPSRARALGDRFDEKVGLLGLHDTNYVAGNIVIRVAT
jgi:hypothetical protein